MKLFLEIKLFLAHTDWGMFSHPPNAHGTKVACGVDPLSKPNAPVTSSAAAARGRKVINAAALVGAAPSKFT